jgi:uncharacterized membrane protein HdeD (DUF308 family)
MNNSHDLPAQWWSFILRGLVSILVGLVTFVWPGLTLAGLVLMFGAYALVDGVVNIAGAWHGIRSHDRWGAHLIEGIVGIIVAAITAVWPASTAIALVYLIAAWSLVTGVFEIIAAVQLRKHISREWLLALSGVISIVFGMLLMIAPLAGALAIALWFGVYAFIFGIILIGLGIKLRSGRLPATGSSMPLPTR